MNILRLLIVSALIAAAFSGCGVEEARPGELPGGQDVVGAWHIPAVGDTPAQRVHFFGDGRFVVDEGVDGDIEHVGIWTVENASRLIVAYWEWAEVCPLLPGAYRFEASGDGLNLTEVQDECEERRVAWTQTLTRVEGPESGR